ncbi:hypothetical protein [Gymnodinialimonas sp.]
MKKIAIIAALAASIAAPAVAQSTSSAFAIAHFNQSVERSSDIRTPSSANTSVVSTQGGSALANAFAVFNGSQDSAGDLRGQNNTTVVSGTPAYAQDIFARLRAESAEDE